MARNGSGTYSVVNAFTPQTGQAISSSQVDANFTDVGTELTNSIAADGQTTITGALKGYAGTVSAPGYSFSADLDCGMYRIGANNIGLAVNGAKVLDIATIGLSVTGTLTPSGIIGSADGSVSAPGVSFSSDLDCGMYRIGTNNIGLAVNGAKVVDVGTGGVAVTGTLSASGATTLAGGALSGTFTGTPTFSDAVVLSGTPSISSGAALSGTFSGAATFSGACTFSSSSGIAAKNTAKAWASISYSAGTPTLQDSFNVASITDNGVGDITITFTNAFQSQNYVPVATAADGSLGVTCTIFGISTSFVRIVTRRQDTGNAYDPVRIVLVAFGA